jgi:hypothetical protein
MSWKYPKEYHRYPETATCDCCGGFGIAKECVTELLGWDGTGGG